MTFSQGRPSHLILLSWRKEGGCSPQSPLCRWLKGSFGPLVPSQVAAAACAHLGSHEGLEGAVDLAWGDAVSMRECDRWRQGQWATAPGAGRGMETTLQGQGGTRGVWAGEIKIVGCCF